jgi:hypothetical protein
LRGKADILATLERAVTRMKGRLPAEILVNAFVNFDAASGQHGPALAEYLVGHGVDVSHVSRSTDEDWIVIFNPKVIRSVTKVPAREVGEGFAFDLPKVKRNPLAKPTADMGFSIRKDALPGVVEVYLYDINDLDHPERAMIAGAMLVPKSHKRKVRWEATGMAACPGYGPLIYDLAASVLNQRLHPTDDRSAAAKAFWAKQPHPYIDPLPPEAFAAKYGITVADLYAQGADLAPHELQRMSDELTTVFFSAREAEAAGKPAALARCRPNRSRR